MAEQQATMASIIVVNKNDPGIFNTLKSLADFQSNITTETIVVDASSGTMAPISTQFPKVKWIDFVPPVSGKRTIAEQRNVGLSAASGRVIIFLDANCIPSPGWLEAISRPILDGNARAVTGPVRATRPGTVHDLVEHSPTVREFSTMNVALDQSLFEEVGTFDESLGMAEDVDFAWRLRANGVTLHYNENALISHDWGGPVEDLKRALRYGRGRVRLYQRHPDQWRGLFGPDLNAVSFALFDLSLLAVPFFPFLLVVAVIPLVKNAHGHPFKTFLYNIFYGAGILLEVGELVRQHQTRERSGQGRR